MTETDTTYNGWSNRQTWAANLWLGNDEPAYRAIRARVAGMTDAHEAGTLARAVWRAFIPATGRREAEPVELINWDEIGAGLIEE